MCDHDVPNPKNVGHISKFKIVHQTKQDLLKTLRNEGKNIMVKSAPVVQPAKASTTNWTESPVISPEVDSKASVNVRPFQTDNMGKFSKSKPNFRMIIGSRPIQIFTSYLPSIGLFTVAGTLCTMYICEWKSVLQYVPFYGGKYKKEE